MAKEYKGFDGMDFTNWMLFKMLIQIYGEDRLIEILNKVKVEGGIKEIRTRG